MSKKNAVKTIQSYLDIAKQYSDAGCLVAYDMALGQVADAMKWYSKFTGKKYTIVNWKVAEV